jgi:hypothetical protein
MVKKGVATPYRSRTPARGPLLGPNVLPWVRSEKSEKTEKDKINKKQKDREEKTKRTIIEES